MEEESDTRDLTIRLENALQQSGLNNEQRIQAIRALLIRSVAYGRAGRVLGDNPDDGACLHYVDQLITHYNQYHTLVTSLERGEPEAWTKMGRKIHIWANGYLIKGNIHGPLRKSILEECVPNAVMAYLSGTYYFDTDFDAWSCVLVQNVCRKHIKEQLQPNHKNQAEAVSLDRYDFLREVLADNNQILSQQRRELRSLLLEAVEKLSSQARQELIILYYFEGYSFKEIAKNMNKSMNATYKLHFDALAELRENSENWY